MFLMFISVLRIDQYVINKDNDEFIQCFQQPSSSVECGYYALKYMDDIIKSVKEFGVENIDAVLNDIPRETRPLRSGEMRELNDKIATYLANICDHSNFRVREVKMAWAITESK
ncbi:uncharacterized protein LOC130826551 [Amaranthus tricolor]|uniref:uncharacterized protein LOC130826551 n=1 Tax=Amaranthus tricolor TaxID=29722 RepID=UPI0025832C3F|nr:uncharacterized protein LOC130826551 [Amaranthus tricolor]